MISIVRSTGRRAAPASAWRVDGDFIHRLLLRTAGLAAAVLILYVAVHGYSYYRLPLDRRVFSPLHQELRPSGSVGIRLGLLGLTLFFLLFLYPIRKRWPWLSRIGNTRRWLNFHVLLGVVAPLVITLHSSFKFQGIAGMAYWIMAAVSLSGFVGRYLYAQIPRSVQATDLTLAEIEAEQERLAGRVAMHHLLSAEETASLLRVPNRTDVARMGVIAALVRSAILDACRPFRVSRIRRRRLNPVAVLTTLGGLLPSGNRELEDAISATRAHAWISTKLAFLQRTQQVFHLWHVVHRPFSLAFVALVAMHVVVAVLFGYYQ